MKFEYFIAHKLLNILKMMGYIITAIVFLIIGFIIAARTKDNINIGFGNKSITIIDGEIQEEK